MRDLARSINHPHSISTVEYVQDAPKYRRLLRPIGAYFDRMHACELTLAEIESGFFWRFFVDGDFTRAVYGEMPYDGLFAFDETCKRNRTTGDAGRAQATRKGLSEILDLKAPRMPDNPLRGYSSGYEKILRSLAVKFDADRVSSVLLVEGADGWLIRSCLAIPRYVQVNHQRGNEQHSFHDSIYQGQELADLITTVRDYRGRI